MKTTDKYGRIWDLPKEELCPTCGQPDNCGDCSHQPLTVAQVKQLASDVDQQVSAQ